MFHVSRVQSNNNLLCRCRGKTVKLIDSRPLQIALCVLVLVDVAVVIAEILLDMHAIRSQSISHRLLRIE